MEAVVHQNKEENVEEGKSDGFRRYRVTIEPIYGATVLNEALSDSVLVTLYMKQTCEVQLSLNSTVCGALGQDTAEGRWAEEYVQPYAADYLMWKLMLMSVMPAVLSMFIVPWTDKNGRKPALLFGQIGMTLNYCVFLLLTFVPNLHPAFLLFGVVPFSLVGGRVNQECLSVCCIIDIVTPEERMSRISIIAALKCIGSLIGLIVSPYIFNWTSEYGLGFKSIFAICSVVGLLSTLYIAFFFPESIQNTPEKLAYHSLFDLSYPVKMLQTCFKPRPGSQRFIVLACVVIMAFIQLAQNGEQRLLFMLTRLKFVWDLTQYHDFEIAQQVFIAIGTPLGVWLMPKYLNIQELGVILIGCTGRIAMSLLIAFAAPSMSYFVFVGAALNLLKTTTMPSARVIMNEGLPAEDNANVNGLAATLIALLPLLAGPVYVQIYNAFLAVFPGAFLLFTAALFTVNIILAITMHILKKRTGTAQNSRGTSFDDIML